MYYNKNSIAKLSGCQPFINYIFSASLQQLGGWRNGSTASPNPSNPINMLTNSILGALVFGSKHLSPKVVGSIPMLLVFFCFLFPFACLSRCFNLLFGVGGFWVKKCMHFPLKVSRRRLGVEVEVTPGQSVNDDVLSYITAEHGRN